MRKDDKSADIKVEETRRQESREKKPFVPPKIERHEKLPEVLGFTF
jgi:hypothetical protein